MSIIDEKVLDLSDNYEGKTETEQLIRQAAYELQIEPLIVKPSLESPGTYEIAFKSRQGNDQTVNVPMDASFTSIHDALKFAYKGKPKHDPEVGHV